MSVNNAPVVRPRALALPLPVRTEPATLDAAADIILATPGLLIFAGVIVTLVFGVSVVRLQPRLSLKIGVRILKVKVGEHVVHWLHFLCERPL